MTALMRRAVLMTLLALLVLAPGVVAITNCAQFISSSADDSPLTGWLMGEQTVSTSSTSGYSGSWSYMNFGGTFNGSSTTTVSYSVGTYQMSNGTIQYLRCDSYTYV